MKIVAMPHRLIGAAVLAYCLTTLGVASANGQMTHEETVVRQTYAKLAYAVNIGSIHRALEGGTITTKTDLEAYIAKEAIQFQLNNFSSGKVSDIAERSYGDFVTKPDGSDTLAISTGLHKMSEEGSPDVVGATARVIGWHKGQDVSGSFDIPFAKAMVMSGKDPAKPRYAAYTVTTTFQNRSRTIHALFLFNTTPNGEEYSVSDTLNGSPALFDFINQSVYPSTLLKTRLRAEPAVADWLRSHQVFDAACKPGREETCCNPSTLVCGVSSQDVNTYLSKPVTAIPVPAGLARTVSAPTLAPTSTPKLPAATTGPVGYQIIGGGGGGQCSGFNSSYAGPETLKTGVDHGHITGDHQWTTTPYSTCTYTNPSSGKIGDPCAVKATAQHVSLMDDTGILIPSYCHETSYHDFDGLAAGFTSVTATAVAGGAVKNCFLCGCSFSLSLAFGLVSVSFPPDAFFDQQHTFTQSCGGNVLGNTPIIIDTTGHGYTLTSTANGVKFDIAGNGKPFQIAWTDTRSGNAFLALDRNGNGKIDSGKELFGNYTEQPNSQDPNGFLALAVFDKPENGGNGDGIIDERDKVWASLLLWVDANHNGISEPEELFKPEQLGIHSIGLKYTDSRRRDEYGNLFRYKGAVNSDGPDDGVQRVIWDVFLNTIL
jgi:hypothetical protein